MSDISEEIDEMIGSLTGEPTPAPEEDTLPADDILPAEEIVEGEESNSDEAPPGESPPSEESLIEPPSEELPLIEESEGEETSEDLKERIRLLTERVEELTTIGPGVVASKDETPPPAEKKVEKPVEKPTADVINFVGDLDVDELIDSKDKLNEVLSSVHDQAVRTAEGKVFERVLLAIPEIVLGHMSRQTVIGKMVKDFYSANEDLVPVRRTVAAVANNIHAENPDWEMEKVFAEAATGTRKILGLKKRVEVPKSSKFDDSPAFAKGSKGKPPGEKKRTGLQSEIDDFINIRG